MKNQLLVSFILLLAAACSRREPVDILVDYEVAMTSDKALRYYYQRMPENDTIWTDYRTFYENGEKFVVEESFAEGLPTSRYKYKVNGGTHEVVEKLYYHVTDSATGEVETVTADILRHLQSDRENDYSGFSFVDYYETSMGIGVKLKTECKYDSKETYHYNGRDIESIRLDHQLETVTYFKWLPFYFFENDFKGYVLFSKGVGMTYYEAEDSDGKTYIQKLVKVEELM